MTKIRPSTGLAVWALVILLAFAGVCPAAENRGNAGPRSLLPEELRDATVADHFIPGPGRNAGSIQGTAGFVVVRRSGAGQAYWAVPGDRLYEGDTVYSLKNSRCRFKLLTSDEVTMGERTRIVIREHTLDRAKATKSSAFQMLSGKAIFLAARLAGFRQRSMTVETETAVSGVRGTKFGMEVRRSGDTAALSSPIQVASLDDAGFLLLARSSAGEGSLTVVHGIEGKVAVRSRRDGRSQTVGPGRSIESSLAGLGKVFQTPARVMKAWVDSIEKGAWKVSQAMEKAGAAVEEKMKKPTGAIDRMGKALEKKLKF